MRVFSGVAGVPADFGPSAVAIGKFDGVHRGHRAILDRLTAHARELHLESVVVTFDRNPLEVLAPDKCPHELVPLERRLALFDQAGVGAVLVLPFTRELAAEPAGEFIDDVLVATLHSRIVLAGRDFRFGHRGAGDVALLQARGVVHGFTVEPIEPVIADGLAVSSTRIRRALDEGNVDVAADLLGRLPEVSGLVVPGAQRGRELGFPTANLGSGVVEGVRIDVDGFIPADGVYAGWAIPQRGGAGFSAGERWPTAVSIGTNPTFEDVPRTVEAHILDHTLDLYGLVLTVQFVAFVRPMVAFSGIGELIAGIRGDVARVREVLGAELPGRS